MSATPTTAGVPIGRTAILVGLPPRQVAFLRHQAERCGIATSRVVERIIAREMADLASLLGDCFDECAGGRT